MQGLVRPIRRRFGVVGHRKAGIFGGKGVILDFNRLLLQKRLANIIRGHYNAWLGFYGIL